MTLKAMSTRDVLVSKTQQTFPFTLSNRFRIVFAATSKPRNDPKTHNIRSEPAIHMRYHRDVAFSKLHVFKCMHSERSVFGDRRYGLVHWFYRNVWEHVSYQSITGVKEMVMLKDIKPTLSRLIWQAAGLLENMTRSGTRVKGQCPCK